MHTYEVFHWHTMAWIRCQNSQCYMQRGAKVSATWGAIPGSTAPSFMKLYSKLFCCCELCSKPQQLKYNSAIRSFITQLLHSSSHCIHFVYVQDHISWGVPVVHTQIILHLGTVISWPRACRVLLSNPKRCELYSRPQQLKYTNTNSAIGVLSHNFFITLYPIHYVYVQDHGVCRGWG